MTMIAHAAFDLAVQEQGLADPAALLARIDATIRILLPDDEIGRSLATNMDAALCRVEPATGRVTFAGAHIDLFRCSGGRCERVRGNRRSLGERRRAEYSNAVLTDEPGATYYLTTDGFLDQAGGSDGFGFGPTRFASLLARVADQPMPAQLEALRHGLHEYQGARAQRDDIAVLGFRIPRPALKPGTTHTERSCNRSTY